MKIFIIKIKEEKLEKLRKEMHDPEEFKNKYEWLLITKLDGEFDNSVEVLQII